MRVSKEDLLLNLRGLSLEGLKQVAWRHLERAETLEDLLGRSYDNHEYCGFCMRTIVDGQHADDCPLRIALHGE